MTLSDKIGTNGCCDCAGSLSSVDVKEFIKELKKVLMKESQDKESVEYLIDKLAGDKLI